MEEKKKVIAVVPVAGREPLLKYTIGRLAKQIDSVICIGHTSSECDVVESSGGIFYPTPKASTLGQKWTMAVNIAKELEPDAIMIMGSASMVSDNWIDELLPHLDTYDMVGAAGIHYFHYEGRKLCYWAGYPGGRHGEPIGVGRLIRRSFLEKSGWNIFDKNLNSGLDSSTMKKIAYYKGSVSIIKHNACSVRVSTDKWINKNGYYKMAPRSKALKGHEIDSFFPELKTMEL